MPEDTGALVYTKEEAGAVTHEAMMPGPGPFDTASYGGEGRMPEDSQEREQGGVGQRTFRGEGSLQSSPRRLEARRQFLL